MIRASLNAAYLLMTGVILIAVALSFLVYRPMMTTLSEQRQVGRDKEKQLTERKAFLTSLESKKNELDNQRTNERTLSVALPATDDIDTILRIVQQAAQTSGGSIGNLLNTSQEEQRDARIRESRNEGDRLPGFVVPLSVSTEFVGSYQQLRVFVGELEKSSRLIDIKQINIARSSTATDVINASLTLRFYRYGSAEL